MDKAAIQQEHHLCMAARAEVHFLVQAVPVSWVLPMDLEKEAMENAAAVAAARQIQVVQLDLMAAPAVMVLLEFGSLLDEKRTR